MSKRGEKSGRRLCRLVRDFLASRCYAMRSSAALLRSARGCDRTDPRTVCGESLDGGEGLHRCSVPGPQPDLSRCGGGGILTVTYTGLIPPRLFPIKRPRPRWTLSFGAAAPLGLPGFLIVEGVFRYPEQPRDERGHQDRASVRRVSPITPPGAAQ